MKRSYMLFVFVGIHLAFIFLQIHKHSSLIKLSYLKQRYEQEKIKLTKQKETLTHQLYACQNKSSIKEFATTQLGLEPIHLNSIRIVGDNKSHDNVSL